MIPLNGTNTFAALYGIFTTSVLEPIQSLTSDVLSAANIPLVLLLIIMLTVIGIGVILGQTTADGVVNRLIRMSIVVTFIAGSSVYFHYVQSFFLTGLPEFFSTHIISVDTGQYGASRSSPGAGFDHALSYILYDAKFVAKTAPTGLNGIVPRLELALTESIAVAALAFLFAIFIIVQTLLGIVIVIGPILVIGYLFDYTKRITDGWISALITLSLLTLVVDIVVLILVAAVNDIFSNLALTANFETNLETMLGAAAGIAVIAFAVAVLPRVIEGIGGGVALGLGLEHSNRWLRGSPLFMPGSRGNAPIGRDTSMGSGTGRQSTSSRIINRIRNRNKGNP